MVARKVQDQDLVKAMAITTSPTELAKMFSMSTRAMTTRLRAIGVAPLAHKMEARLAPLPVTHESIGRLKIDVTDGRIVVFSDAHFQPGCISTANRALLKLLPELRPNVVVCNGDALDGAAISRWPKMFGSEPPTPAAELRACDERMDEIADAAKGAKRIWTLGNHDIRLHSYIQSAAPALADMDAMDLRRLFPKWEFAWSLWVNDNTVIKHRFKGGVYAPANNVKGALGMSFVTGHLHSMKVMPLSSYADKPTSYGVDTGMLAEPEWDAFGYREDSPADWRSGFVVLTWRDGRLLWPEVVSVLSEGRVEFRGEVLDV
jgi:Calcineurin-like phosphoesterase